MYSTDQKKWLALIIFLIIIISVFHYSTPTSKPHYHLIYMQAYFIPIILAAFVFGKRGGLGSAIVISIIYFPHIMLQWGGLTLDNLMRFMQIFLFNIIGYITGLKAQGEREEKERFQKAAMDLKDAFEQQQRQSDMISDMEQQLRASDRLATVGELVASLAHEVRNPLGSIRGAVEIIRDAVPEDVKKMEFFDILIQDTQRLSGVVENYLSYAKKQPASIQVYDLQDTIRKIVTMLEARARKNKVKLETLFTEKTLMSRGDPTHFWQAIMNILLNAVQAMPDGGTIMISVKQFQNNEDHEEIVKVDTDYANAEHAEIHIKDQGPGIDAQNLDKIFQPFYTTRSEGTGLGLAIVKRLSDENHWHLKVKSYPDEGTEFIILIPVEDLNQ
jgi:signal transduction histidine kinase